MRLFAAALLLIALLAIWQWRSRDWPALARADAEAAISYVEQTHPGLAPEIADERLIRAVAEARQIAADEAGQVTGRQEHDRFMRRLSGAFHDPHVGWLAGDRAANDHPASRPHFGLEADGRIGWLTIPSFAGGQRSAVLEQIEAAVSTPVTTMVIDLRGNNGGDSRLGDALRRLFPEGAWPEAESDCPVLWRASAVTLAWVRAETRRRRGRDARLAAHLADSADAIATAIAQGRGLSGPVDPDCLSLQADAGRSPPLQPQLAVITDRACFSSCLITVDKLRRAGAIQLGGVTRRGNHYQEVATTALPSGLGRFSSVLRVDFRRPYHLGPFVPDRAYDGAPNEAAFRCWVTQQLLR